MTNFLEICVLYRNNNSSNSVHLDWITEDLSVPPRTYLLFNGRTMKLFIFECKWKKCCICVKSYYQFQINSSWLLNINKVFLKEGTIEKNSNKSKGTGHQWRLTWPHTCYAIFFIFTFLFPISTCVSLWFLISLPYLLPCFSLFIF